MPQPPPSGHRQLAALAWPEVERLAGRAGSTVIWPFGAIEQQVTPHG